MWNLVTGECQHTLQGHEKRPISSVAIAPDGKTIVTGSRDESIKVWGIR
ncbi:MAG: hypothetical protein AB1589_39505 [Cyanobacteriota bacterium]